MAIHKSLKPVSKEGTMAQGKVNWTPLLSAALSTVATLTPTVLEQHWNGDGTDGKINNAIQIIKDAALAGATLEQNLSASKAAQSPHPDTAGLIARAAR